MRRPLRSAFVLGVLIGVVVALLRSLAREGRPGPTPLVAPPTPLPAVVRTARTPVPVDVSPAAPDPDRPRDLRGPAKTLPADDALDPADPGPHHDLEPDDPGEAHDLGPTGRDPQRDREPDGPDGPGEPAPPWVAPVDGGCPEGHPIKAKASSGIFHRPGGLSYERTSPDRCYLDAAAAEADGFRAAKR